MGGTAKHTTGAVLDSGFGEDPARQALQVRLPERVRLTREDIIEGDVVVYAIGRTATDLLVEVEEGGVVLAPPLPLGGFFTHAPHLVSRLSPDRLEAARTSAGLTTRAPSTA